MVTPPSSAARRAARGRSGLHHAIDSASSLRFALRRLSRHRTFAALSVLTLTLGVGACLLTFAVTDSALRSAVPFDERNRLVWIGETDGTTDDGTSLPQVARWREESRALSSIAATTARNASLSYAGRLEEIPVAYVSSQFFGTVEVWPVIGRPFAPDDDRRGAAPVVIISNSLWRTALAGAADVIGRTITIDAVPRLIVGVMPPGFTFPGDATLAWIPMLQGFGAYENTGVRVVEAVGRLRGSIRVDAAEIELRQIAGTARVRSAGSGAYRPAVQSLREHVVGPLLPRLRVLLAAGAAMLMLACVNVGNMLVAQVLQRSEELALRRALGGGHGHILRLLLGEVIVLVAAGAIGGYALAAGLLRLASRYATSGELPEFVGVPDAARGLALSVLLAAAAAVALSALVYIQVSGVRLGDALRTGSGGSVGTLAGARSRRVLTAAEVALTLVLLLGAAVLAKAYATLAGRSLGFDTRNVYTARISRPYVVFTPEERPRLELFMDQLIAALESEPGFRAAAVTTQSPGSGNGMLSRLSSGESRDSARVGVQSVSPGYFAALGLPIRAGRAFAPEDGAGAPAAVIDEVLARRIFQGREPLGRSISLVDLAIEARVVGVVSRVRQAGAMSEGPPQVYLPYDAFPLPWVTVVVRSEAGPRAVSASLQRIVRGIDREQPLSGFASLSDVLADRLDQSRFYAVLITLCAVSSVLVTGVGLYGTVALLVAQRTAEIGVRMSLGASPRQISLFVMREGCISVGIGLAAGAALALVTTRLLTALLYGISPLDPAAFGAAIAIVVSMALVASLLPAARAATISPATALRTG